MEKAEEKERVLSGVSRRSFMKASAAAMAGLALSGTAAGCSNEVKEAPEVKEASGAKENLAETGVEEGEWRLGTCNWNCGSRCVNFALVNDGTIVRQKTDDTHEHTADSPQLRGCVKGRSQRRQICNPDRIKYPMKRKSWQPGGGANSHGELRGKDEWERISWDDGIKMVADEIKRIYEQYGPAAALSQWGTYPRSIGALGGTSIMWGTASFGTWLMVPHCIGWYPLPVDWSNHNAAMGYADNLGAYQINDRIDLRNCDTVILWGSNPAWSSAIGIKRWMDIKNHDTKFIVIDPFYNDAAVALDADWYPVRPSTDVALMLGMTYVLLEEDDPESNPLLDWDAIARCTVGFDAEHPHPELGPSVNLKDYVLGKTDNEPKTPEWASEICGLEPERIRTLARELAMTKKVAVTSTYAPARTRNGESFPHMLITLGVITGHFGKSGHCTGVSCSWRGGNGGPYLVTDGTDGMPSVADCMGETVKERDENWSTWLTDVNNSSEIVGISMEGCWESILNKKALDTGVCQGLPGVMKDIDIHLLISAKGQCGFLQTIPDVNKAVEAFRSFDLVIRNDFFFTSTVEYSDFVFPAAHPWERVWAVNGSLNDRETGMLTTRIVEPAYEIRTDEEFDKALADALGIGADVLYPLSDEQRLFNIIASTTVVAEDGETSVPLVTITQEDIDELGVEGEPQEGRVAYKDWVKQGVYSVKRSEGDNYGYIAFEDFYKDPEANPLPSETGKFEIASKFLADKINAIGYSKIEPYPTFIPQEDGIIDSYTDWENKVKGPYPLQACTPHYPRRVHTTFENVRWLQEAWEDPVIVNAQDAAERGVKQGDTVIVTSKVGKMLRRCSPTNRVMPGVVLIPHGRRFVNDENEGLDRGGCENTVIAARPTGQGTNGYNTTLVDFQLYDGEQLPPDIEVPLHFAIKEEE